MQQKYSVSTLLKFSCGNQINKQEGHAVARKSLDFHIQVFKC